MTLFFPLLQRTCALVLLMVASAAAAQSEPAFWRATLGKSTVYLLGSMHFGHEKFFPLPATVEQAYERADVLVVEVDMSRITAPVALETVSRHGRLPSGQALSRILSKEVYAALTQTVEQAGLPLAALQPLQPWFVAVQLIEAEIRKTALRQNLGIDLYFLNKGGKPVEQLETLDQQLSLFGGLSLPEQEKFLRQTLRDLDGSGDYLKILADAWRQGDLQTLEHALIKPFKDNADTKQLFDKVFTQRNQHMTEAVLDYLSADRDVFFVVGVGHMLGEQGMLDQLQSRGVNLHRVSFDAGVAQ